VLDCFAQAPVLLLLLLQSVQAMVMVVLLSQVVTDPHHHQSHQLLPAHQHACVHQGFGGGLRVSWVRGM
jgi:hypothetical protein